MKSLQLPPRPLFARPSHPGRPAEEGISARRRGIPFRVLADAFATEDEELAPEPEGTDFAAWTPCR